MKHLALVLLALLACTSSLAQDDRQTVAVPVAINELGRATFDQYLTPITQKITQILNKSKRFIVVNRSEEEVQAERDFQSNPEFLDRMLEAKRSGNMDAVKDIMNNNAQYKFLSFDTLSSGEVIFRGADYILKIELRKLDINKMTNADGTTSGYRTLLGIQLSVIDAETNEVIEAEGFTSEPLKVAMTSPVRSVDESLLTMENAIYSYMVKAFPVKCRVVKIEESYFVINAGVTQGVKVGDTFTAAQIAKIAGAEVAENIGTLRVKALSGSGNAVCTATAGAKEINDGFKNAKKITCTLVKSKRK